MATIASRGAALRLAAVVLAGGVVRWVGTFRVDFLVFDETIHIPGAREVAAFGAPWNSDWAHPPLAAILRWGSMALLGDNPYGWRMGNVVLGTATIALVYGVGRKLLESERAALLAAALLALDPFHACYSRTTFTEIAATALFLSFLLCTLAQRERGPWMQFTAGVALGLTVATKGGYYAAAALLVLGLEAHREWKEGQPVLRLAPRYATLSVLLPAAVHLATYLPWLRRGYSLPELVEARLDALWALWNMTERSFDGFEVLKLGGKPWQWFVEPIVFGHRQAFEGGLDRFLLEINNPPFRLLVLPAAAYLLWRGLKRRSLGTAFPALLFLAAYAPFFTAQRPLFSYSAIVLLPFAYLCVARVVELAAEASGRARPVLAAAGLCVLAWGCYTFPLYSMMPVPASLYAPVLHFAQFVEMR